MLSDRDVAPQAHTEVLAALPKTTRAGRTVTGCFMGQDDTGSRQYKIPKYRIDLLRMSTTGRRELRVGDNPGAGRRE